MWVKHRHLEESRGRNQEESLVTRAGAPTRPQKRYKYFVAEAMLERHDLKSFLPVEWEERYFPGTSSKRGPSTGRAATHAAINLA